MNLDKRLSRILMERTRETKVQMTRAEREAKLAKGRDMGADLYKDFTKFMADYLNSLKSEDLTQYKIMNRDKAVQLVSNMITAHPQALAMLGKMHLPPEKFVARFWNKMDMKEAIQGAVTMMLKGAKGAEVTAPDDKPDRRVQTTDIVGKRMANPNPDRRVETTLKKRYVGITKK